LVKVREALEELRRLKEEEARLALSKPRHLVLIDRDDLFVVASPYEGLWREAEDILIRAFYRREGNRWTETKTPILYDHLIEALRHRVSIAGKRYDLVWDDGKLLLRMAIYADHEAPLVEMISIRVDENLVRALAQMAEAQRAHEEVKTKIRRINSMLYKLSEEIHEMFKELPCANYNHPDYRKHKRRRQHATPLADAGLTFGPRELCSECLERSKDIFKKLMDMEISE